MNIVKQNYYREKKYRKIKNNMRNINFNDYRDNYCNEKKISTN